MFMCAVEGFKCSRRRKQNASSAVLSTEGRVVGRCWAKLKPKGPKGGRGVDNLFESISHLVARKASSVVHVQQREQRLNLTKVDRFIPQIQAVNLEEGPEEAAGLVHVQEREQRLKLIVFHSKGFVPKIQAVNLEEGRRC